VSDPDAPSASASPGATDATSPADLTTTQTAPTAAPAPPATSHVAPTSSRGTRFASTARVLNRTELRTSKANLTSGGQWRQTLRLLAGAGRNGAPPVLVLLVAIAFLSAQDRIDRNDPKLALAPVHGHQELAFKPIDRGTA
jgi:hypothetical protein